MTETYVAELSSHEPTITIQHERGPGRPRIGQQVKATLTDDQRAALAAMVKQGEAKTISDAVRLVVARGLA